MALQATVANPVVELNGQPIPGDVLPLMMSCYVDDSLATPDLFVLTFRDPDRIVLGKTGAKIGQKVTIRLLTDTEPAGNVLIRNGEITAIETEVDPSGTLTIVRGFDMSHRLFGGNRSYAYPNATYADIAGDVAKRAGLKPGTIDRTPTVHPHVTQHNVNDWFFLRKLAREIGFEVLVDDGALHFRKPKEASTAPGSAPLNSGDPLQLTLYEDVIRLRCVVSAAEQVDRVEVRGWSVEKKAAVKGVVAAETDAAAVGVEAKEIGATFKRPPFVSAHVPFETQAEVDVAARSTADAIAGSFVSLEAIARGNPLLRAGVAVSIGLAGKPFDGKYVLTSTRHVFDEDGYSTWLTVSGRNERSMLGLMASGAGGEAGRIPGVVPAIVTDIKDPLDRCRVKVGLPWLEDKYETDWIRTAQLWGGNGYGAVVVPEVNDEVLVAFEHGDIRRPYVIGSLYNGVDKPDTTTAIVDKGSGKAARRSFTTPKKHRVSLIDAASDSGISITTGEGKCVIDLKEAKQQVVVRSDGSVEIVGKTKILIDSGGDLEISAASIKMRSQQGIEMEATGKVSVKGMAGVDVQGAAVSVSGDASAEVKAGGPLTVKGTPVSIN